MWTTITVDPLNRLLFVSTGNPASDFDRSRRRGADLYTNSVVVLDADSGNLQWYVQQNSDDERDWDTGAAPMIYEAGNHNLMAVGSKDGEVYFYDRDSHQLLAREDVSNRVNVGIALSYMRATRVCPGVSGGVEWNGPAFDPQNGLLFVNSVDWCSTLTPQRPGSPATPVGGSWRMDPPESARGGLHAFDAATRQERWTYAADTPMHAGITPTATGLLFTGSGDGSFLVFDSKTGRTLYTFYTGGAVVGGISAYLAAGNEYVAVVSGNTSNSLWSNTSAATLIVFGLP